jgi:hypothetical protein
VLAKGPLSLSLTEHRLELDTSNARQVFWAGKTEPGKFEVKEATVLLRRFWLRGAWIALFSFPLLAHGQLPVVKLIATGGTIAMKIDPIVKAPVPTTTGQDLISTVPEIAHVAKIEIQDFSNVPSANMDAARWIQVQKAVGDALSRPEVSGVIISHGTDTMEETAYFLDLTVASEKPIVLVGAQRNGSETRIGINICRQSEPAESPHPKVTLIEYRRGRIMCSLHRLTDRTERCGDPARPHWQLTPPARVRSSDRGDFIARRT